MAYGAYPDYLAMLAAQPQEKMALVDDAASFTYGELVQAARSLRAGADFSQPAMFIHEDTIAGQLLQFVAYSGTATRPIIATELSKNQHFEVKEIPPKACMGVMTSGSTGKSKLLWRDYHKINTKEKGHVCYNKQGRKSCLNEGLKESFLHIFQCLSAL